MSAPRLASIIAHHGIGEFKAAALDADGLAWRLFSQSWGGEGQAALGQVLEGRIRTMAETQGGAFVELENKQEAYLATQSETKLTMGMAVQVEVQAEARRDKLVRVKLTKQKPSDFDAFAAWRASLPGGDLRTIDDAEAVDEIFDEALLPSVTLPNGGRLHIQPTLALTAIDVDTAGRITKGSAGARALSVNRDAACEAARQIVLRDIGGAIVLDCIAPLNKASGETVRTQFLEAFMAVSRRRIEVLAPSRFGLMEAAIAWGACPLADRLSPVEADLLAALRDVAREADATRADLFRLDLSPDTFAAYQTRKAICDSDLAARFGGRIIIAKSEDGNTSVRRR